MKVKTIKVLEECIEQGVEFGWNRAHKYEDKPESITIKDFIKAEIMNQVYEWFTLSSLYGEEKYE